MGPSYLPASLASSTKIQYQRQREFQRTIIRNNNHNSTIVPSTGVNSNVITSAQLNNHPTNFFSNIPTLNNQTAKMDFVKKSKFPQLKRLGFKLESIKADGK
jgi:hypothetical protein